MSVNIKETNTDMFEAEACLRAAKLRIAEAQEKLHDMESHTGDAELAYAVNCIDEARGWLRNIDTPMYDKIERAMTEFERTHPIENKSKVIAITSHECSGEIRVNSRGEACLTESQMAEVIERRRLLPKQEPDPKCPRCGCSDVTMIMPWIARSTEDQTNEAKLDEWQCAPCNGRSFWI